MAFPRPTNTVQNSQARQY